MNLRPFHEGFLPMAPEAMLGLFCLTYSQGSCQGCVWQQHSAVGKVTQTSQPWNSAVWPSAQHSPSLALPSFIDKMRGSLIPHFKSSIIFSWNQTHNGFWVLHHLQSSFCFFLPLLLMQRPEAHYNALSKSRTTKPWWHKEIAAETLTFKNFLFCFVVCFFIFYFEPGQIFSLDVFPSLIFEDRREVPRGQGREGDRQTGWWGAPLRVLLKNKIHLGKIEDQLALFSSS